MRTLALAFFSILMLSVNSPASPEGAASYQSDVGQQQKQGKSSTLSGEYSAQTYQSNAKPNSTSRDSPGWLYRTYLISGPIVAIVALGTGVVVWRQIVALQTIERAWVMVDLATDIEITEDKILVGQLTYTNNGQTPAWVHGVWLKFDCFKAVPHKPDLAGLGKSLRAPHPFPANGKFGNTFSLRIGQCEPGTRIIIYGLLKYTDIFRRERSTCFGYHVTDKWKLERLSSNYNRYD